MRFSATAFSHLMDDTRAPPGTSRLYLVDDIYRAPASDFLAATLDHVREALVGRPRPNGCPSIDARPWSTVEKSRTRRDHGHEEQPGGDIIASMRATMGELVEKAIDEEIARRGTDLAAKGLSARILADMLLDALDGMKMRGSPRDAQQRSAAGFVKVVETVLSD